MTQFKVGDRVKTKLTERIGLILAAPYRCMDNLCLVQFTGGVDPEMMYEEQMELLDRAIDHPADAGNMIDTEQKTLRDEFAMSALIGLITNSGNCLKEGAAKLAYA